MFEEQRKHGISDEWLGCIAGMFVSDTIVISHVFLFTPTLRTMNADGSRIGHDLFEYLGLHLGYDRPP